MRLVRSLQGRLALVIGLSVALVWIITALIIAGAIREEMNRVFDSALEETAQRILPLAVQEIFEREDDGTAQLVTTLREHDEFLTYVVRDRDGRVLLRSHDADIANFPPFQKTGFSQTETHVLYYDAALGGDYIIAIAEPLAHREDAARESLMTLALPLFILLPVTLGGIWFLVRLTLRPLHGFRNQLAARDGHDLTAVDTDGLPDEITPVAEAVNSLLQRLHRTLEAERNFASNAAHELRTPVAGALAQAQRLIIESRDEDTRRRAADIEVSLKRLNRLSEKLMQLARAEGSNLRTDTMNDLTLVLKMVVDDLGHTGRAGQFVLDLSDRPVMSNIDTDIFAILVRNLLENARLHGAGNAPVNVSLDPDITLRVSNAGPVVPPEALGDLTRRFSRGNSKAEGSGLGLAIVHTISSGIGGTVEILSPALGRKDGFEVILRFEST